MNIYNQAYTYVEGYVQIAKQWMNPQNAMEQLTLEQKLRKYLEKIDFSTKYSQPKIVIDRICIMFCRLIEKYPKFQVTDQKPVQYIENQTKEESKIVSIFCQIKVKAQKINCRLHLSLVIHSEIEEKLPLIFIRNPNPAMMQLKPDSGIYKSILGGLTFNQKQKQMFLSKWKQYKQTNLLDLVESIQTLLCENFPFIKRHTNYQIPQTDSQEFKKVCQFKQILKNQLSKIQQVLILKQCINSEQKYLQTQNKNISKALNIDPLKIIQQIKVVKNEQILNYLCMERAFNDCLKLIEGKVENVDKNNQKFYEQLNIVKQIAANHFEVKWKILDTIDHQKEEKH